MRAGVWPVLAGAAGLVVAVLSSGPFDVERTVLHYPNNTEEVCKTSLVSDLYATYTIIYAKEG